MPIFRHELRRGRISLLIWTGAISFMLGVCVLIYPEMGAQMGDIGSMFANMGSFSEAFGMDKINFGEFAGFFSVECGNVLGIGGAFFAALLGVSSLAKEEKERTAEFLLTHPVSRPRIIAEKLCAVLVQILILNTAVIAVTVLSVCFIRETVSEKTFALLFLAYFLMQLEIAAITFGISAFLKRGNVGIGIGLSAVFYFLNILANLTDDAEFLKYLTPFGYTDGADIIAKSAVPGRYLTVGIIVSVVGIVCAFWKYSRKDVG
ncbi:MAG: ABC transporter permease subunit [Lachnospiraceae bacterium]|nr:ABC transporter permease subunit [Lachnospiraceae bacterium]